MSRPHILAVIPGLHLLRVVLWEGNITVATAPVTLRDHPLDLRAFPLAFPCPLFNHYPITLAVLAMSSLYPEP
jgi:hypothetical protein